MENPSADKTTEKTKETEQHNTIDLLNPMSGYVQHTTFLEPILHYTQNITSEKDL
jgi:hypothetical protein